MQSQKQTKAWWNLKINQDGILKSCAGNPKKGKKKKRERNEVTRNRALKYMKQKLITQEKSNR